MTTFNASLAGHALLGHLLEVPDHDPGDVDEEGRPCCIASTVAGPAWRASGSAKNVPGT